MKKQSAFAFKNPVMILVVVLFVTFSKVAYAEPLNLVIPDFEPYTYKNGEAFKGQGVDAISAVMTSMDQPFTLRLVPNYGRALQEVKENRADGFFLATENNERNEVAVLSSPILMNRWSWFLPVETTLVPSSVEFMSKASIATHLNTNTHKWLLERGYKVAFAPDDIDTLTQLLVKKRVTAVFIAESVFLDSLKRLDIDRSLFQQVVEEEKPMGIYVAKRFLEKQPQFMEQLNHAIHTLP